MKEEKEWNLIDEVRIRQPIIHCITNYVTANDIANMLLAAGASPIMADNPEETRDIAGISHGLVLNLGTLKETSAEAMLTAGCCAAGLGHPVVLDPVGAGASAYRQKTAVQILKAVPCSIIRGNASEIRALVKQNSFCRGVDADGREALTEENRRETVAMVQALARQTNAVIVMTGATDLVADRDRACFVKNGSPMMSRITGTGCMMDGVLAAVLAASEMEEHRGDIDGAGRFHQIARAVAAVGICGELAEERTVQGGGGTGSFRMHFIDVMSQLKDEDVRKRMRCEQAAKEFNLQLYAVTDRAWTGRQTLLQQLEEALKAGVTLVQLREKDLDEEEFIKEARQVRRLTDAYGIPLIINDNIKVALACGAAGIHVGQEDLETGEVRRILGPDKIIGVTAKTVEQAKRAEAAGADYLGSGAVFGSATKQDALPMTMERLREITSAVSIPVVAIGGIHAGNAAQLAGTGAAGAAVVSGIFGEANIGDAVRSLRATVEKNLMGTEGISL